MISSRILFALVATGFGTALALTSGSDTVRKLPYMSMGTVEVDQGAEPRKRIAFIRHGRSYMNDFINGIHYGGPGFSDIFPDELKEKYHDSPLTDLGKRQAENLHACWEKPGYTDFLKDLELVLVSPLTRALQTMKIGLMGHLSNRQIPVVALPQAAERLYMVSDQGKPTAKLKIDYDYIDFDSYFEGNENDFWHFVPNEEETSSYVEWRPHGQGQVYACLGEPDHLFERRMQDLCNILDRRPERNIALVCHYAVIDWLIQEGLENCEARIVDFDSITPRQMTNNQSVLAQ